MTFWRTQMMYKICRNSDLASSTVERVTEEFKQIESIDDAKHTNPLKAWCSNVKAVRESRW